MKNSIIIIGVIFLVIIGGFIYIHFFIENPIQEKQSMTGVISISATDSDSPVGNIVTGFNLSGIDVQYEVSSQTSSVGTVIEKVPFNYTYKVFNFNLNNQNYYSNDSIQKVEEDGKVYRVIFQLKRPGNFQLGYNGSLNGKSNLSLQIKVTGNLKKPIICTTHSADIIFVTLAGVTPIEVPKNFNGYSACFQEEKLLTNELLQVPVEYKYWDNLLLTDNIQFIVADSEFQNINKTLMVYAR